jgi:hypothetical protein
MTLTATTNLYSQTDMSIPLHRLNVTIIEEGTREAPKRLGLLPPTVTLTVTAGQK